MSYHLTGHTQSQFEEFFGKTPLGRYILKAEKEMQAEFFHRYLQDFISMTMNLASELDLQVGSFTLKRFMIFTLVDLVDFLECLC